jgi:FixJ family two-component response regulator
MRSVDSTAVVIVEDDPSMSKALARILRLAGLMPKFYRSAEALLAADGVDNAMCLILDVQLPGMSGFALRDRLLSQGAIPPVIFITAFDEPDARAKAAKAGAAFLAKPFGGRLLLETIQSLHRASVCGAQVQHGTTRR